MNNKKFCFITCVSNQELYSECLYYINNLNVPEGYEVEILSIENAESIASGYNEAMRSSDAKYKIYLHQDILLINKNILYEILDIFSNENIGMIGVCGSEIIGTDGVWWNVLDKYKFGKIYEYREDGINNIQLSEINEKYKEVQVIDGVLMITQYDIPWREDIIDGWHFYDSTQSVEFIKNSYSVVVPKQNQPWCLHDSGLVSMDNYDEARKIFLKEYGKYLFPLVSILIPTYNRPEYFKLALESAINQTYPNIEIIVGDDSTNNDTEVLIKDYMNKYDNISYYHNKENLGQYDNDIKLLNMCNGRYVNFLMDDDLFALNKIEKMMHYFINYKDESIAIVTSNRMRIDEKGNEKEVFISPEIINQIGNKIFDGKFISNYVLNNNYNIIGEPTTVLFDKTKLGEEFGEYNGRRYICNVDQAAWFNLLNDNKIIILADTLSYFRIHEGQQLKEKKNILGGLKDYIFSIITARDKGLLIDDEEYSYAIDNCLSYLDSVNKLFDLDEECRELVKQLNSKAEIINKVFPKISILMIVDDFNEQIEESIMSVLIQYYCNYELIIGYKNEEIIKKMPENIYKHRKVVLYKLDEKLDYKSCIKELINISQGEYINYLSNGSKMNREMIRMLVDKIECDKSKIAISNSVLINKNNEVIDDNMFTNLFFRYAEKPIKGNRFIEKIVYEEANHILNMSSLLVERNILLDSLDGFNYKYEGNIEEALVLNVLEDRDISIQLEKNVFIVVDIESISGKYEVNEEMEHYTKMLESKYNEILSKLPLVSVIITTYNTGDMLRDTIDSILNQTYRNIELIIVDDASTDNTKDIILSYDDKRIRKIFLDKNRHVCYSGNVGFKEAKGKYVAIIGHDDLWHKSKIEEQVAFLEENPSYGVCFTSIDIIDENGQIVNDKHESLYNLFYRGNLTKNEWARKLLLEGNCLCAPSALINKEYLDKIGYYKYGLIQLQDYDLWIRMVIEKDIYILNDKLTYYRRFTEEDKNLSASTYEKQNRSCHEFQWIQYKNIWNMPIEKFRQVFNKDIKCKDIVTEKEAMCEKAFLLWEMRNCYAEKIFLEMLEDEECRNILENKYKFGLKDFYQINAEAMLFDNSLVVQVLDLQNKFEEYLRNINR